MVPAKQRDTTKAETKKIVLDPITRVEGHLAVKTEIADGKVVRAEVAGEMFRGFEVILRGRDPLDAQQITQRICGVCPIEHGMASILAQDMAFGIEPPPNGRLVRNLVQAANIIASHVAHFYLLSALDFVDVAMVVEYVGKDPAMLALKGWVPSQLASKNVLPAAPFLPRYAGDYLTDKDANLGALRNYLEAIEIRRQAQQMGAIFAGKMPHAAALVPGGVTETVTALRIESYRALLERVRRFIDNAFLNDVVAVAGAYPGYFALGRGCGNFLAYGVFPEAAGAGQRFLPPGVLLTGKPAPLDPGAITEDVGSSLFSSPSGLAPASGQTVPAPDKANAYSWLKAPRYQGQVMEVGPLARLLVAAGPGGNSATAAAVNGLLQAIGRQPTELVSVMGRHAARALECKLVADHCHVWLDQLVPGEPTAVPFSVPATGAGFGLTEAARGALGHWIEIRDRKIANYQCVVPTTWNCSPRDDRGIAGPVEQALEGTPVADAENPLEVARVIRSFDPCLACAVH